MSVAELERRVRALEEELSRLRGEVRGEAPDPRPWWEQIWGSFAGDPAFDKAMRLGRKYRESMRPKPRRRSRR